MGYPKIGTFVLLISLGYQATLDTDKDTHHMENNIIPTPVTTPAIKALVAKQINVASDIPKGYTLDWYQSQEDPDVVTAYITHQGECIGYAWVVVKRGSVVPQHPSATCGSVHLGKGVYLGSL